MYYVYILKCSDDSLYTGYTIDINKRIEKHNNKLGAKCLKGKLPAKLIYQEKYKTKREALKREIGIKKLKRKEKIELIKKN